MPARTRSHASLAPPLSLTGASAPALSRSPSPVHERAVAENLTGEWTEWAGYLSAPSYALSPDIEYTAVREAAGLIDVSPLFKYRVAGPDSLALVGRVITRDPRRLRPGRVIYTPWCDEAGHVIDDGTLARLDDGSIRWTAADPQVRWLELNARGLDVTIDETTEALAALAVQGPRSRAVLDEATGVSFADLGYYRRRAASIGGVPVDISRTGYTGDLGYEVWVAADRAVEVWDALVAAGRAHDLRPVGLRALDLLRLEAGLILLGVDYVSSRHAAIPDQLVSPFEIGLGRLVDLESGAEFVGRRALVAERAAGGSARRLAGLEVDWEGIEARFLAVGLAPSVSSIVSRVPVPVYAPDGPQIGRMTSSGWSPQRKALIGLATVDAAWARAGGRVEVEWTVEARRSRVEARVVKLPFQVLPRKKALPAL